MSHTNTGNSDRHTRSFPHPLLHTDLQQLEDNDPSHRSASPDPSPVGNSFIGLGDSQWASPQTPFSASTTSLPSSLQPPDGSPYSAQGSQWNSPARAPPSSGSTTNTRPQLHPGAVSYFSPHSPQPRRPSHGGAVPVPARGRPPRQRLSHSSQGSAPSISDSLPHTPVSGSYGTSNDRSQRNFNRRGGRSGSPSPANPTHGQTALNSPRTSGGTLSSPAYSDTSLPSTHSAAGVSDLNPHGYRIGQVISTSSSVFEALFHACFDASPRHVSTADLLSYQSVIDRAAIRWRPCIVAELPDSPQSCPKVYILTTLSSDPLSDVPNPMAHWVVRINTQTPNAADDHGIDTEPPWCFSPKQWVIPFAFRPTAVQPRGERVFVNEENLAKLRTKGRERAESWRSAFQHVPTGVSWRLMKDRAPDMPSVPVTTQVC
jgi:hypothetical protein